MFLYKAMEALVASNHAVNPVIPAAASNQPLPPDQTSPVAVAAAGTTVSVPSDGKAAATSNGGAVANGNGNGHHNSADQVSHISQNYTQYVPSGTP